MVSKSVESVVFMDLCTYTGEALKQGEGAAAEQTGGRYDGVSDGPELVHSSAVEREAMELYWKLKKGWRGSLARLLLGKYLIM